MFKSHLNNITWENRLNRLANLKVHREIPIKNIEMIDIFSDKNRRLRRPYVLNYLNYIFTFIYFCI